MQSCAFWLARETFFSLFWSIFFMQVDAYGARRYCPGKFFDLQNLQIFGNFISFNFAVGFKFMNRRILFINLCSRVPDFSKFYIISYDFKNFFSSKFA